MISIVIPVYNRPVEAAELLESLAEQTVRDFEVVIVEDGSQVLSDGIVNAFRDRLRIAYYYKENGGPGPARNFGAERARGDFLIFLDSDTIVPAGYVETVENARTQSVCFFGGPDMAGEDFTAIQKAVSYSMTSFFTTGGIRGGRRGLDRFIPRSFNMGISRAVFEQAGGFAPMRFGEDIDLSMRIIESGVKPVLLPDAAVYHKRRTRLRSFFRQVFYSGMARVNLTKKHPGSFKPVHLFPTLFTLGSAACLALSVRYPVFLLPFAAAALVWFGDSSLRNHSLRVGALSVVTSFTQLYGYGLGFLYGVWMRIILRRTERQTYQTDFH